MTITSQQVDAWVAEVDAAYASGVAAGATAERALWELSRLGQEIEAQPEQDLVEKLKSMALQSYAIGYKDAQSGDKMQLAQPEQHDRRLQIAMRQWENWKAYALDLQKKLVKYEGGSPMILNTRSERLWVGLTDEELAELSASGLVLWGLWRAIEAKLKEKNFD